MATKINFAKQTQAMEPKPAQKAVTPEELNQRIRKRAQEIFEKRGRTAGHELEDWLSAERQVKKELRLS